MAELHYQHQNQRPFFSYQNDPHQQSRSTQVVKAATAVTAVAALILAGTVVALTVVTPLFVIFSPVLVPAVMAVALLSLGFLASGGFGVAAITVLAWIYRYITGKHPLDTARHKLVKKAREIKDYGQQQITGEQAS
uniref:Oleosin 18.5 kDa n=1 Tax=Cajanus cajan TaxID=3821 RepID=A0A151T0X9_CAJCA|nr:Oleosin 18.5 kDa [Cajanus cajan]